MGLYIFQLKGDGPETLKALDAIELDRWTREGEGIPTTEYKREQWRAQLRTARYRDWYIERARA